MALNFRTKTTETNTEANEAINKNTGVKMNLAKTVLAGQRINLSKQHGSVTKYCVGLKWNEKQGISADCDASIVLIGEDGNIINGSNGENKPSCLLYYNQLELPGLKSYGDNKTGNNDEIQTTCKEEDEQIDIDLHILPDDVHQVLIIASTHSEVNGQPGQTLLFGRVASPVVTIYDNSSNEPKPLYTFELDEENSISSSVEIAKFYRKGSDFIYVSMGDHVSDNPFGLQGIIDKYGIV